MTITATFDTQGDNTFSFPIYINNQPTNNTAITLDRVLFQAFDDNEIGLFRGDQKGFFLAVLHGGEPVEDLECFETQVEFDDYVTCIEDAALHFTPRFPNDVDRSALYTYVAIHFGQQMAIKPRRHWLLQLTNSLESFVRLYNLYESLYRKNERYFENLKGNVIVPADFFSVLTDDEQELLKFSIYTDVKDCQLDSHVRQCFLGSLEGLTPGAFESFGISDDDIEQVWRAVKLNVDYFIDRIRSGKMISVFYGDYDNGNILSYVDAEGECRLWRTFPDYMKSNYQHVSVSIEPPDFG